jgi:HrpA-like RNA helicase
MANERARRAERRRALVPAIRYPAALPIVEQRDELLATIGSHQVVIVAGETGSGKSTQLPKMCLELGRGVEGLIGHTQPRRLAARTVAERIAEELATEVSALVGYTIRFNDRVGEDTLVRLMTDGILLAEIQRDRMLTRYDTIIVDEAHERSLNIDFILGYLKQLCPAGPTSKWSSLGDDRHGTFLGALRRHAWSRCPAAATRSRCATAPSAWTTTTTATRPRPSSMPSMNCGPSRRATSSCS